MIDQIIAFSVKNKLIVLLLTFCLIGGGIWSITKVPIDAVPDITNNQVQVMTQAPNLGTEDIEQFVTYPVEVAMANLPGVKEIRSVSRFGLSVVTIVFEEDMGTYLPRQLVNERLSQIREEIPEGFGSPSMGPISTGLGEIYQYTLQVAEEYKDQYGATDLRSMQDWIVRRQMAMVQGVVEVNAFGGKIKQYEVAVNPDKLKSIGLTITEVFHALEQNNQNTGGAYIEKNHLANFIRGEGLVRSLKDLESIVVKNVEGIPIHIRDVATVQFGHAVRYGAVTKDGQGEAVGGMILMMKGANSDEVIKRVKERIAQIQLSLPEGVTIEPILDRSALIDKTSGTVVANLVEGALIVIFVLVFLLGNWRGGLIVASTIPLSLLFAFMMMYAFDVWANLMSLGAIDFGIIVDGAVIIVEGTVFFLIQSLRSQGKNISQHIRDEATIKASSKMMNAAFFGQLIILIVFLPLLSLEGVEGKMFKPMALTFMFAMLGAMLLCLTYVPMISALFIRVTPSEKKSLGDKVVAWVETQYGKALQLVFRVSGLIIGLSLALLGLAIFTYTRMGGEFVPQLDEGDIAFHIILKPGSSLSESIEASTKVEKILKEKFPEIEHAMTRFGVAEVPTDPMPMDLGDCIVTLKPQDEWVSASSKEELIAKMKEAISIIPGLNYEFTQPIEMRFNELLTGVREDVAIKLYGDDLQLLASKAQEIGEIIAPVRGVGDMRVEATDGLPQITVRYKRADLAQYGLEIAEVNQIIQMAFAGGKAGVVFEGERRFDLVVRLDNQSRTGIKDLKRLYINTSNGAQIPLSEVATINYQMGPMQISRDNTNRRVSVGVNVRGRDVKTLVEEIKERLNSQLKLPPGYYIRYGGAFENLERATSRLQIVVPIALFLIFVLIFFALRNLSQSLMIYIAIPLAAIGGVFSLWLRGMPFSISAGVGFIVLFGVAVLNGLVLISGWNDLKKEGSLSLDELIRVGAKRRVRPILLTALTDVLGFLPMAISSSAGAEVQRPLATVVIGGLLTSTLLTLFILPILYKWIENRSLARLTKPSVAMLIILAMGNFPDRAQAQEREASHQEITLEEALSRAVNAYPKLQAAQLEVQKQQALKNTALDLGNTKIFNSGEEMNLSGEGVYTILGIQQQQIDVFAIKPRREAQQQQIALAEAALSLSEAQLKQQVKQAYAQAWIARQNLYLYAKLDSTYTIFEKAAKLRYEVEETSKLAYLAASTQAKQVQLQREQAQFDYQSKVYKLNLWLANDTIFEVSRAMPENWTQALILSNGIEDHPILDFSANQIKAAAARGKVAQAALLPKLGFQYGTQVVGGQAGFFQYQIGVSLPILAMKEKAKIRAAKIEQEIAQKSYEQADLELQTNYWSALQEYHKWNASWEFYQEEALPLAEEQRHGAMLAYKEGELGYIAFIQHLKEAIQVEVKAQEALEQLLKARFKLAYYLQN